MGSNSSFDHHQRNRSLQSNTNLPDEASSPQKLFSTIRMAILNATESHDLTFDSIAPETGLQLASSFCEDPETERAHPRISYDSVSLTLTVRVMPTHVHGSHQSWLEGELSDMRASNFLTATEARHLKHRSGTTFQGFADPYTFSSKDPDDCIRPDGYRLPTVVVETGYPESWPRLDRDKDLWLLGGTSSVKLVFLIRWSKVTGRIKGEIQVHSRDAAGNPILLQTEPIFPAPPDNPNRTIQVTRGQLFGATVFPSRNAADSYPLSVANLRAEADSDIRLMGYIPA